ncbi:MAG: hypothetical protein R3C54_17650 [Parvularculaceae bacterium]|nr:hypothetical protein [Caulobacterales bacterium]
MKRLLASLLLSTASLPALAAAPALPAGLGGDAQEQEETDSASSLPSLPMGLSAASDEEASTTDKPEKKASGRILPENISGFIEGRVGVRTQDDPHEKQMSIGETRLQLEGEWEAGPAVFSVTSDFIFDPVEDDYAVDLETGRGAIDLREANVVLRPTSFMDIKAGRQILTWGTGDLVFINDMFPKDYRSFFIGRDDEYLKAPSDAVRASFFTRLFNLDVAYTPRFDPDRYIDGSRISYFNPLLGERAGRNAVMDPLTPDEWFDDDEIAARASRNIGAYEAAVYAYRGYWKSPQGMTALGLPYFPELSVYGASLRGPVAGGIGNMEVGYYDSREDRSGVNPLVPNSQFRYLIGYEREAMTNLTVGVQYYAERTLDYDLSPSTSDRTRHLVTVRLTKLAMNQNLTLSLFNFWSPNQHDGYVRSRASYKLTDDWLLEGGFNIFYGKTQSFFGQFEDNTNVFVGARRSF